VKAAAIFFTTPHNGAPPATADGGPAPAASPLPAATATPAAPARLFHVLIAEDSSIVCERLTALIQQLHQPIRVSTAADGTRALELFRESFPDAVVLDIELPGLNGFDLLAQFRLLRPRCVVIVLTTYAYPEFRDNALRLGADHFFSKTMEFERVPEVLAALLAPAGALTPTTGGGA
jgi:DNA-binding NarL/FixJ family response regulator